MKQFSFLPGLAAAVTLLAPCGWATDLEVTKVALYKHGVGFFERAGELAPGASSQLNFKASEMDDILKSLVIRQTGGNGVAAVRYDSADPLEKRLESFSFRVGRRQSLAEILDQFKGAELTVRSNGDQFTGLIVSARSYAAESDERQELLLASPEGVLRTVDPRKADSLRFTDSDLQDRLFDYLSVLAQSRNAERRRLLIESAGGSSEVNVAYLAPAAIWKTSYRLALGEDESALLEGWAIVDNTSGDDWNDVELSLVSGLPVSFVNSLYAPRYVQRRRIELKQDPGWEPVIHGAAIVTLPPGSPGPTMSDAAGGGVIQGLVMDRSGAVITMARIQASRGAANYSATSAADGGFRISGLSPGEYSIEVYSDGFRSYRTRTRVQASRTAMLTVVLEVGAVTETVMALQTEMAEMSSTVQDGVFEGQDLGDLFEYRIRKPVTIPAGQSAMLPFFSGEVEARKILVYDEDQGSQHPLRAIHLANSTGGALDGGAITVYEDGGYVGEAIMETLKNGDRRLVSYAVDLGVRISSRFESSATTQRELHAKDGLLLTKTLERRETTYTIVNVDPRPKALWIEVESDEGFEPVGVSPAESTDDADRYEVALRAGSTDEFTLVEERLRDSSVYIDGLSDSGLNWYVENKDFDADARNRLLAVVRARRELANLEERMNQLEEHLDEIDTEQGRLRSNIATLNEVAGQQEAVAEFSQRLRSNEDEVKKLRAELDSLEELVDKKETELDKMIEQLSF